MDQSRDEDEDAREAVREDPSKTQEFWQWLATLTDEDILTVPEAAAMARMSPDTFRYVLYHSNTGPTGFRLGKKRVFRKGEIRQWLAGVEASHRGAA